MANHAGVPDLTICYKGFYIAIEVKRPGGRVSRLQLENIISIRDAGGLAFIFDSVQSAALLFQGLKAGVAPDQLKHSSILNELFDKAMKSNTEKALKGDQQPF